MQTQARVDERDPVAEAHITEALDAAKPYLLAIATQLARSEQDDIAKALNGLQLVCGRELTLAYHFNDERRIAQGLTTFLECTPKGRLCADGHRILRARCDRRCRLALVRASTRALCRLRRSWGQLALVLSNDEHARIRYLSSRGLSNDDVAAAQAVLYAHTVVPDAYSVDAEVPRVAGTGSIEELTAASELPNLADHVPPTTHSSESTGQRLRRDGFGTTVDNPATVGEAHAIGEAKSHGESDRHSDELMSRPHVPTVDEEVSAQESIDQETRQARQSRFFTYVVAEDTGRQVHISRVRLHKR